MPPPPPARPPGPAVTWFSTIIPFIAQLSTKKNVWGLLATGQTSQARASGKQKRRTILPLCTCFLFSFTLSLLQNNIPLGFRTFISSRLSPKRTNSTYVRAILRGLTNQGAELGQRAKLVRVRSHFFWPCRMHQYAPACTNMHHRDSYILNQSRFYNKAHSIIYLTTEHLLQ